MFFKCQSITLFFCVSLAAIWRAIFQRTKIAPLSFLTEGFLILFTQLYGHTIQRGH